jgi:hypothetical protein
MTNENDNTETVVVVRGLQSRSSARHVQYVEYQRCTIRSRPCSYGSGSDDVLPEEIQRWSRPRWNHRYVLRARSMQMMAQRHSEVQESVLLPIGKYWSGA